MSAPPTTLLPGAAPGTGTAPQNLAWMLAKAHLTRRRTQNVLAILGIAVGVMVLIAALSLTNGFTRALVNATLRASPHLSLTSYTPAPPNLALENQMRADKRITAFTPYIADKGLLTRPAGDGRAPGVDFATLFGVGPAAGQVLELSPEQTQVLSHLKPGEVMLGSALARSVGAFTGDEVRLLNSAMKRSSLKVVGLFTTGNYLIDSGYAFTSVGTLQAISTSGPSNISGYQVRLHNPDLAVKLGSELTNNLPYSSLPWQNLYGTLLEQMALQKKVIAFVVFLIVVVAAFGIANVLTLAVFEKTQEIAILRAIGATRGLITKVFVLEGMVLGLAGLLLGNLMGLGISAYFMVRPFQIPGDLYFITSLPVEVKWTDLLWVNAVGLITTLVAALIPARRAANVEPARIIR